jgi:hypothetical protein
VRDHADEANSSSSSNSSKKAQVKPGLTKNALPITFATQPNFAQSKSPMG